MPIEIEAWEDCPRCGGTVFITTRAAQKCDGRYAMSTDPARCADCGLEGVVSADEDGWDISMNEWDEE